MVTVVLDIKELVLVAKVVMAEFAIHIQVVADKHAIIQHITQAVVA